MQTEQQTCNRLLSDSIQNPSLYSLLVHIVFFLYHYILVLFILGVLSISSLKCYVVNHFKSLQGIQAAQQLLRKRDMQVVGRKQYGRRFFFRHSIFSRSQDIMIPVGFRIQVAKTPSYPVMCPFPFFVDLCDRNPPTLQTEAQTDRRHARNAVVLCTIIARNNCT